MKKKLILLVLAVILMLACTPNAEIVFIKERNPGDYRIPPSPNNDIIDKDGDLDENGIQDIGNGVNIDHDINNDGTQDWGDGIDRPPLDSDGIIDGDLNDDGSKDWAFDNNGSFDIDWDGDLNEDGTRDLDLDNGGDFDIDWDGDWDEDGTRGF